MTSLWGANLVPAQSTMCHYSPGAASWASPITGRAHLAELDDSQFGLLTTSAALPADLLPGFLHELTHLGIYASYSGQAQAATRWLATFSERAIPPDADLSAELKTMLRSVVEDNAFRAKSVNELLRPLHEGFALFAQFDAMTRGRTRAMTRATHSMITNFARYGVKYDGSGALDGELSVEMLQQVAGVGVTILMPYRLGPEAVAAKANVYSLPVATRQGTAYLLGYLLVRRLWAGMMARVPWFEVETDEFMAYVSDFIFHDPGLAVRIMGTAKEVQDASLDVASYLRTRIHRLSTVTPRDVLAWRAGRARVNNALFCQGLHIDPEAAQMFTKWMRDCRKLWQNAPGPQRAAMAFEHSHELVFSGSFEVRLDWLDDGRYRVRTRNSESLPRHPRVQPSRQESRGRVDLVFVTLSDPAPYERTCLIYSGDELIDLMTPHETLQDDDLIWSAVKEAGKAQQTMLELSEVFDDPGLPLLASDASRERFQRIPDLARTIYFEALFQAGTPADTISATMDAMRNDGLYGLLGGDPETVKAVAALSLSSSFYSVRDWSRSILGAFGYDADRTIALLHDVSRRTGLSLILSNDNDVLTML